MTETPRAVSGEGVRGIDADTEADEKDTAEPVAEDADGIDPDDDGPEPEAEPNGIGQG